MASNRDGNSARICKGKDDALTVHSSPAALTYGREIIQREARDLQTVADCLDHEFELAVRALIERSPGGRVIFSGMGKAGFIAMKISATLASIGIPSFFLHPAEAVHGDLGRYTKTDIAFILSNSGETPEILRLLPHLKRVGCTIISLTALRESSLGQHSDIVIGTGKIEEAGPFGMVPTSSAACALAIGDALAMAVVNELGITKEQYAKFHPGGDLGKSLLLVSEIMRTGERNCVVPNTMLIRDVLQRMMATPGRPGSVTVVDANGKLAGILTDGDLRRCMARGDHPLDRPVSEYMGNAPTTVNSGKLIEEALRIMSERAFDELIVVDDSNMPVGTIDIQDIVARQTS